jgi:hypothetical protein
MYDCQSREKYFHRREMFGKKFVCLEEGGRVAIQYVRSSKCRKYVFAEENLAAKN